MVENHIKIKMPTLSRVIRHVVEKRDNMGYAIHPFGIVILSMLGAGFLVAAAFAVTASYRRMEDAEIPRSVSQDHYMREVRTRNFNGLLAETTGKHYRPPQRIPLRLDKRLRLRETEADNSCSATTTTNT